MIRTVVGALTALLVSGCSCEGTLELPCEGPARLPRCGAPCAEDEECGVGLYCSAEKRCTAECSGEVDCEPGFQCDEHGRCSGDGNIPFVDAEQCGSVDVGLTAEVPTVMLVIDQSSSMGDPFPGAESRWGAVRRVLADEETGIVRRLAPVVEFGATLYTSHDGTLTGEECPILRAEPVSLDNYEPIRRLIHGNDPDDDTPTGEAVEAVIQSMLEAPNPEGRLRYLVLATDGEPDRCADPEGQDGQALSIAAVENAFANDIRVFVLGVSGDVGEPHLQDLADAGAGLEVGGPVHEPYFTAGDEDQLTEAFTTIIGGLRSCTFAIQGEIDPEAAEGGHVFLNGAEVPYDEDDGWRVVDERTLELVGAACEEFRFTLAVELTATFPCDAVVF